MGLKDKIKSLFNKRIKTKTTIPSKNIVVYNTDGISIPKYSELSEVEKEQVDEYIKEINLDNLGNLILYANEISENAAANTDLLLKLFFKVTKKPADYEIEELEQEEIAQRRLEAIIEKEQLQLYRNDMLNLERESLLRAVALDEIGKKERKRKFDFLGIFGLAERMKRDNQVEMLEAVTQRMKISKESIGHQIKAAEKEIEVNQIQTTTADIYNALTQPDEMLASQVLKQKVNDTLKMASLVMPEYAKKLSQIELNADENEVVKLLARIQKELDVYAYTHKDKIAELGQAVNKLNQTQKSAANKDKLLEKIDKIQTMYKIFSQYVKPEEMLRLYITKFDILTIDFNKTEELPFANITDIEELQSYEKIIDAKLEIILLGKNKVFNELFGENTPKAAALIRNIFKSERTFFQYNAKEGMPNRAMYVNEGKLSNKRLLGMLLAFDEENGIKEFLNANYFGENDLQYTLTDGQWRWTEKLPLKTIYQLEEITRSQVLETRYDKKKNEKLSPWVQLIELSKMHNSDEMRLSLRGSLQLPVGIARIDKPINIYERALCNLTLDAREIIFPSTLKEIYNRKSWDSYGRTTEKVLFSDRLERIELNEGLETIGTNTFTKCKHIKKITIPSSLIEIVYEAFANNTKIHFLKFNGGLPRDYTVLTRFCAIEKLGITQLDIPERFWDDFFYHDKVRVSQYKIKFVEYAEPIYMEIDGEEKTLLQDIALYNSGEEEPYMHINPKKLCNCMDKKEMLLKLKKEYEEQQR